MHSVSTIGGHRPRVWVVLAGVSTDVGRMDSWCYCCSYHPEEIECWNFNNNMTMNRGIIICFALISAVAVRAQDSVGLPSSFSVGLRGGWSSTTISRYDAGRMDEAYSAMGGYELGVQGRYAVNSWFSVVANVSFMQRSHRMDRNLNYLDPVYTEHINSYLMVPVMADFSFGGTRLRGHLLAGAYAGYWMKERRRGTTYWMTDYYVYFEDFDETRDFTDEDQRLNAGVAFGTALTYALDARWELGADVRYYYDLTSHHRDYVHLADPRYLNTLSFTVNLNYNL